MPRQRNADPKKSCERCGTSLQRKLHGKRLEDFSVFARRRFCSLSCANSKAVLTMSGCRSRARKLRGPRCEACGYQHYLHAHHKDGDFTNNDPTNIQTLCTHCHNFWHALLDRLLMPCGPMPALFPSSDAGFPPEWISCAPSATPSIPDPPPLSSAQPCRALELSHEC